MPLLNKGQEKPLIEANKGKKRDIKSMTQQSRIQAIRQEPLRKYLRMKNMAPIILSWFVNPARISQTNIHKASENMK